MATTTLTLNPQLITVPANTNEHDIDFDDVLPAKTKRGLTAYALIERVSGTSVQFNSNNTAISAASGAVNATQTKLILPLTRGVNLRYKGGAGSETFYITIVGPERQ
jgi:hypothetical protein